MRKAIKKISMAGIMILTMSTLLIGCNKPVSNEDDPYAYLKTLEDGSFYVRHENKTCEKVYFGSATFDEGETTNKENERRIMWFNEDFKNIPTLYEGESLILYTAKELKEEFNFERFEDFGYTIGLCGLKETKSGRYYISTNPKDKNTYPGGDTDAILLIENDIVIIDTLGGQPLRVPGKTDRGVELDSKLTRCGTIKGLDEGYKYKMEVYEGTKRHEFVFTANVKALGSMDVIETTDYVFESETIININIPEEFESGYYMINGRGLFRYVKGDSYDDGTNFNVAIVEKEETSGRITDASKDQTNREEEKEESVFQIEQTGLVTIQIEISGTENPSDISGIIITPEGNRYQMIWGESSLELSLIVETAGEHKLQLYNLGSATATLRLFYHGEGL